ncbi:MAG: YitT family protein [Clostridiales bacterium]|nr:YitT family protein [Clostridiales bacterium]
MKKFLKTFSGKYLNKKALKKFGIDLFFLIVACSAGAFSLTAVMLPNGLTSGGLTGVVRIIQKFVHVDFSILYYGGAIIILVVVSAIMGIKEGRKVLLLSILYPTVIFIFERVNFNLLEEKDTILAAIFCGVFFGTCSGLVFWRGYAFCGTDAIAKIIKKKLLPTVALSQILLIIDASIIVFSALIYGRNIALYALVTQVILTKTVDFVLYGFETKIVQLEIITQLPDVVTEYIIRDIERGVTEVEITGAYTKSKRTKLITLCSPRESILIKKFIAETDKKAFVTVVRVDTVWGLGEGFSDINDN